MYRTATAKKVKEEVMHEQPATFTRHFVLKREMVARLGPLFCGLILSSLRYV